MSFRRKTTLFGGAVAVAAAAVTLSTGAAMASPGPHHVPAPVHHSATAAVELLGGGSEQFALVNAHSPSRYDRGEGFVDYTNFSVPARSRVWSLNTGQAEELRVWALGNEYDHTLNSGEVLQALSNNDVNFTGTGFYNPVPSDNWSVAGNIDGRAVTLNITYGSWAVPAYSAALQGTIGRDGSARGTFLDSNHVTGTWSLPRHTFRTTLNYVASIRHFNVDRHRVADVKFTVPFGNPFAGTHVEWAFSNRHGHEFWAQGINGGALSAETVEAGPISVS